MQDRLAVRLPASIFSPIDESSPGDPVTFGLGQEVTLPPAGDLEMSGGMKGHDGAPSLLFLSCS
jgi:hypothetical protein